MAKHIIDIHESRYSSHPRPQGSDFRLPLQITLGISSLFKGWRISLDNEVIYGKYGGTRIKNAKFWILRTGLEKPFFGNCFLRFGLLAPLLAETSTLGNLQNDIPWPKIAGTAGVGYRLGIMTIDAALSGDHGRSYIESKIFLRGIVSTTLSF